MEVKTRKLTVMAMLTAVSVILVWLIHLPLIPAAPYLEYDPADIPILIGAFVFGPVAGLALTFAAAVLQGLTVSAGSGLYGILMHFVATGTMCLVAGSIYRAHKTRKMAVVALIIGVLATTAVMAGANMLITPLFLGMPASVVKDLLLPAIIPFNLLKFSINSLVTFLLYKMISRLIHKYDKMAFHKKANQEL